MATPAAGKATGEIVRRAATLAIAHVPPVREVRLLGAGDRVAVRPVADLNPVHARMIGAAVVETIDGMIDEDRRSRSNCRCRS